MDEESVVKSKPILLINEYDCLANHGAAIGKMSDETLFYLMSRGLTRNEAFLLVLKGIVKPFLDEIPQDSLKEETNKRFNDLINKEQ
jgi:Fe-S cluster assembly protein SufD